MQKQSYYHNRRRAKVLLFIGAFIVAVFLAVVARADDTTTFTVIDTNATPYHLEALRDHERLLERDRCFPYGCGGITGPIRNYAPRTEAEKPRCYYNAEGKLFYEQEGFYCPYMYTSTQTLRIERRKQEWLRGE